MGLCAAIEHCIGSHHNLQFDDLEINLQEAVLRFISKILDTCFGSVVNTWSTAISFRPNP